MFALFNPPKNRKRSKCSCAGYKFGKSKKGKGRKRTSPWIAHLKAYRKEHPMLGVAQAAKFAAKTYTPKVKLGGYRRISPEARLAELELEGMAVPSTLQKSIAGRKRRCDKWSQYGFVKGKKPAWCGSSPTTTGGWLKSASELHTPSGGRIFAVANNRGRVPMKRRGHRSGRRRGLRILGYNVGSMVGAMKLPHSTGKMSDPVKPANLMGVLPVIGGVIANAMLSSLVSKYIPYTKSGIGNYALGLAGAGLAGGLIGHFVSKDIGNSVRLGGIAETFGRIYTAIKARGVDAFALGYADDGLDGMGDEYGDPRWGFTGVQASVPAEELSGMGDFVTPGSIQRAFPSESTMSQYSLPAASAPVQAHEAYQQRVLAEVISDGDAEM